MRIVIDGCASPKQLNAESATLVAALAAAREFAGERMIVEVLADGLPVPAADLENPPEDAPYADEISFLTADRAQLMREALDEVDSALLAIGSQQEAVAAKLQTGHTADAMQDLSVVLRTWDGVQQMAATLAHTEIVAGSLEEEAAAVELSEVSAALLKTLHLVRESVLGEDWSTLADILSFDLSDLAARWRESMACFRGAVGG
ncbi:MAG: hypothetical protein ACTS3F_02085 [Phycisphaerales bacterium]